MCVSAAKCTTASWPGKSSSNSAASQTSPTTSSTHPAGSPAMFAEFPAYVSLSSTVTRTPGCSRAKYRTKSLPMKPQPPVTRMLCGSNASAMRCIPSKNRRQRQAPDKTRLCLALVLRAPGISLISPTLAQLARSPNGPLLANSQQNANVAKSHIAIAQPKSFPR